MNTSARCALSTHRKPTTTTHNRQQSHHPSPLYPRPARNTPRTCAFAQMSYSPETSEQNSPHSWTNTTMSSTQTSKATMGQRVHSKPGSTWDLWNPKRKGRLPQYARNQLLELQQKFDEVEALAVFRHPEDIDISVEYLNPSFLIKNPPAAPA